jgi:hypothetical protein
MVGEVELSGTMTLPQGLKPMLLDVRFSARLKSCPDTKPWYSCADTEARSFDLMDSSKVS